MDNLTHSLFGAHLSRLPGFDRLPPRVAFWTCIAASNAPDVDGVLRFWSEGAYLFEHRGITHALVGMFFLAPAVALLAGWISRGPIKGRFGALLAVSFAGVAGHLLLDLLTSWGTMLLLPFSHDRLALPWLFIVDVWLWVLLGAPLLWSAWRRRSGGVPQQIQRRASATVIAAMSVYVSICAVARERARQAALDHAAEDAGTPQEVQAWPAPFGPLLWTTLVRTDEELWVRGFTSALTGGVTDGGRFRTGAHDPRVQVALSTELGRTWQWWAEASWAAGATLLEPDGSFEVTLADLRFSGPFWDSVPFGLWMRIGPDFRVIEHDFRDVRIPAESEAPSATVSAP